jgi:hypothetical protein
MVSAKQETTPKIEYGSIFDYYNGNLLCGTMTTKILVAIAVITVILGVSVGIGPLQAYAATKTFQFHQTNVPLSFDLGAVCTSNDNVFTGRANLDEAGWDSNKVDLHLAEQGLLTDSATGNKVGEV